MKACVSPTIPSPPAILPLPVSHAERTTRSEGILLDVEPQQSGEDEVAAATRLVQRVAAQYPRAFDVVIADALYARVSFFETVVGLGKDVIAVLKHDEWELTREARALSKEVVPTEHKIGETKVRCLDVGNLPRAEFKDTVRVLFTAETTPVRRQLSARPRSRSRRTGLGS